MRIAAAGFPHTQLLASGEAVGLPHGEDGNTETGHLNIGAGQVVYQDLPRINMAVADGSFFENPALVNATAHARSRKSRLHLLGLVGSGGVHSSIEHLFALMRMAKNQNVDRVILHLITDGRDSPPTSALTFIAQIKQHINQLGVGTIAGVMGRYYAMDRDHRFSRTEKAYFCLTRDGGLMAKSAEEVIKNSYAAGKTDEFIEPTTIISENGQPVGLIKDSDAVIFFNFRIDRPRQLTKAFVLPDFKKQAGREEFDPYAVKYYQKHLPVERRDEELPFDRGEMLKDLYFVTMTRYEVNLPVDVAFPPQFVQMPLGRLISDRGWRQLRLAETEKERFVTYYFNGQREEPFPGEDRLMIPSPAVATYDLKPEMSTPQLWQALSEALTKDRYDFIAVNVACPDMVAHTGNLAATIRACQAADAFVGEAVKQVLARGGAVVITGDHGNAEEMINPLTGGMDTEHSVFPVPFHLVGKLWQGKPTQLQSGVLADVAPTILKLMEIEKPSSMTGKSLI
jgi:2,3-bisphosphoglycerate-independent phosphoglycerate mutase